MTFTIQGEAPSKKNSRVNTRSGRSFPSKKFMEWHDAELLALSFCKEKYPPIDSPSKISVEFVHGDKRRRDSDNQLSSILDLLVDARILKDDGWEIVREISVKNSFEKKNARAIVSIVPL
ncbi:MAG: RusA family crossover junction endodeoxyribonuclease [Treponema sp.]|uniref:RusA family crossover junction endodeoxyribonuclease n=1 Tax=Treponema sp. TaxID=166 RepID=UPI00257A3D34|nr:RusA family crossover junction endodeoxyribonuclease [Treponema sp.]MBQ5537929.1 RusA family crossover junction endodeoxyribonuclease [Treponema sp.]